MDNSTVKNGISKTDISGGLPNGGGIYSFDSNLTIKNETNFLDNKSVFLFITFSKQDAL